MSAFRRLFNTVPATRRQYSVFSSKPGGGRYFNSAKANKTPVVAAKRKSDSSSSSPKDPATTTATAPTTQQDGTSSSEPQASRTVADTQASLSSSTTPPQPPAGAVQESDSRASQQAATPPEHSETIDELFSSQSSLHAAHPMVSANDFKLHQFFSLHRPLLLLNNTQAMFTPGPSLDSVFGVKQAQPDAHAAPISVFEDYPADSSIDADAVAARQLGRALAMSKIGARVSWEGTLTRLGLDPSKEPEQVVLQEQMDKDWEDVQILLDSTKRKRRKKMKKHK